MTKFRVPLQITTCVLLLMACAGPQEIQVPRTGGVSSAHPLATEAGLKVLANGGNAYDAAIAVASEIGVSDEAIVNGLKKFQGVGRRFQFYGFCIHWYI